VILGVLVILGKYYGGIIGGYYGGY
jgi:hypothetical protein